MIKQGKEEPERMSIIMGQRNKLSAMPNEEAGLWLI